MDFSETLKSDLLNGTCLYSMGQAGFILKSRNGQTLGIDLYLSDCVERVEGHDGYHRLLPKIVEPKNLNLDILIATHFHRDHFDVDAIPELMSNGRTILFCACDCAEDVERLGVEKKRVTFVKPGDHYKSGDFDIHFIHSDHGIGAPQEVGVIITVDGKHIVNVGDTCLHLDWKSEYQKTGVVDVLIAPINGAYGNLSETECAELAKAIGAVLTVPSHFGMFASHGGNAGIFIDQMRKQNLNYRILTMGEGFELN